MPPASCTRAIEGPRRFDSRSGVSASGRNDAEFDSRLDQEACSVGVTEGQDHTHPIADRMRNRAHIVEEIVGHGVRQLPHADVVDDQERHRCQIGENAFAWAVERRVRQFIERTETI